MRFGNALTVPEVSTPSAPASGSHEVYYKSDGNLYQQNSSGNEGMIGLPIGSVTMFVGTTAPTGWLFCNGAAVSRTTFSDLFAVTSTNFGLGNGTSTFNLPDMRSRLPFGINTSDTIFQVPGATEVDSNGSTVAPGAGDSGRMNHSHTHTIVVAGSTNTSANGGSTRVTTVGGFAPQSNGDSGNGTTAASGVNGANQQYHGMLALNFIIKAY